jgi:hypothetical protein
MSNPALEHLAVEADGRRLGARVETDEDRFCVARLVPGHRVAGVEPAAEGRPASRPSIARAVSSSTGKRGAPATPLEPMSVYFGGGGTRQGTRVGSSAEKTKASPVPVMWNWTAPACPLVLPIFF